MGAEIASVERVQSEDAPGALHECQCTSRHSPYAVSQARGISIVSSILRGKA